MKKFFVKKDGKILFEFTGEDLEVSDEWHSIHELYEHRLALTKALFHSWRGICIKSKQHSDGTMFEGGYFIVQMNHPKVGQISYHYKLKHWDEFDIIEVPKAEKWDGHTSLQALERISKIGRRNNDLERN